MFIITRMRNICVPEWESIYNERAATIKEQLQWKNRYNARVVTWKSAMEEYSYNGKLQWLGCNGNEVPVRLK